MLYINLHGDILIGLIHSINDPAGSGIAKYIKEYYGLDKCSEDVKADVCYQDKNFILAGFREDVIYFDFLDDRLPSSIEYYIILSRHSSSERVKSYTVHHTGNFGEALYGGKPSRLAIANPPVSHKLLLNLREQSIEHRRDAEYEVSYEATHHGPTEVNKPLTFIEIGSSIDEWRDIVNHEVVGLAIIVFMEKPEHECHPVIGIGGGHYPRKHTELAFNSNYCYGHIMPKYALQYLSEKMVYEMINRSKPKPSTIIVEKKGTRVEHRTLLESLRNKQVFSNLEYI